MTYKLKEGGAKEKIPNLEVQLKEYYKIRKWDPKTGYPSKEYLKELNLEFTDV